MTNFFPKARLLGQPLEIYEAITSTNTRALELLQQGASEGTTVLTYRQTQGRGQRGHLWESADGGIYLSVILRPQLATEQLLQITLWSAWGVCWALRRQGLPVLLKWPNDLVCHGKKLGGLLTETHIQGMTLQGAVVGVGLNGHNQAPAMGITLAELLPNYSYDATYIHVLQGLEVGYRLWQKYGFERIARYYNCWWLNHGQQLPEGMVTGIDALGRLCVVAETTTYYYPGQIQLGYQHQRSS